jgi:phosphinothricin acetyltransferase
MTRSIRTARPEDAQAIAAIYAPYVLETAISFEDVPPTPGEMAARLAAVASSYPFLVCEADGEVVGYAYAGAHRARAAYRWSVDTTAYVALRLHGQGIGSALYGELLHRLARQGFHTAFAGIALPNDKSVGLHEALGFRHLGTYAEVGFKFGKWHDVGWWRRPLADGLPAQDPLPPP